MQKRKNIFPSVQTEDVWEEFRERLLIFIKRHVRDDALAEDILHDVFIKIHKNLGSVRDGKGLKSWMYQITRNTIIDYYRGREKVAERPREFVAKESGSDSVLALQDISHCLQSLLEHLPEKYREAVVACDVEGRSQKAFAEQAGLSLSGAKSRVQRGRAMLKASLQQCCQCESLDRKAFLSCASDAEECDSCSPSCGKRLPRSS